MYYRVSDSWRWGVKGREIMSREGTMCYTNAGTIIHPVHPCVCPLFPLLSPKRERERERERICAYDWGGFGFWLLGDDATPLTYRFHVLRAISSVIQAQWYTIIGILYPAYTFPYVKCPMWNVSLLWMLNEDRYWVQQMASSGQNSSSDNDLPSLPYLNPQLSLSVEHTRGRAKPFRNSLYFHKYLQPLQGILGTSDPLCHLMKFFCKIKRQ